MKDVIIHNTSHKFKFWDRIKILLGKELTVHSEIETEHEEARLTGKVECRAMVARMFPRKLKGEGYLPKIKLIK